MNRRSGSIVEDQRRDGKKCPSVADLRCEKRRSLMRLRTANEAVRETEEESQGRLFGTPPKIVSSGNNLRIAPTLAEGFPFDDDQARAAIILYSSTALGTLAAWME